MEDRTTNPDADNVSIESLIGVFSEIQENSNDSCIIEILRDNKLKIHAESIKTDTENNNILFQDCSYSIYTI